MPIFRTFTTAVAGVGEMDARKFLTYSAIGGVLWATGVTLLGYFLGNIDWIKNNIQAMALLIVAISVIPIIVEYLKSRRAETRHRTR